MLAILYLRANITVESFLLDTRKLYVYNYKGVHYRVFCSLSSLRQFLSYESKTWIFECSTEKRLDKYLGIEES